MQDVVSVLELKVPPPAITLIFGVLIWLTSSVAHFFNFTFIGSTQLAAGLILLGFIISLLGFVSLHRSKTTISPTTPNAASSLVIDGVYKFTRNPMYVGLLLALLGWSIFLSNAVAFAFVPIFVLYINRFQIIPEERALAAKFGADFVKYKASVRRWL